MSNESETNRILLIERTDIAAASIQLLQKVKRYFDNGGLIVYTDEKFVNS